MSCAVYTCTAVQCNLLRSHGSAQWQLQLLRNGLLHILYIIYMDNFAGNIEETQDLKACNNNSSNNN